MGGRLLKRWVVFPLKDLKVIKERQAIVTSFIKQQAIAEEIELLISQIGDLERIISKVALGRVNPREIVQLKIALKTIEPIKELLEKSKNESLNKVALSLDTCFAVYNRIKKEINLNPPQLLNKGGIISNGVNTELDELRQLAYSGKDYLLKLQKAETERTGISSLKIAFNNVFGYYIEVRNTHKDKVPPEWIRKQTLVNAERYITEELKEYEEKIVGAEEKIVALEEKIFKELVAEIAQYVSVISNNANQIGKIDCLLSFARAARINKYICPIVDDSEVIDIKGGRHPVIEKQLPPESPYISNDVFLDRKKQQILIITGPNMAGKSALLRQTALIALMAQIGSFVPADSARLGFIDKIFTRVGASDNISLGESTFMVEMTEASAILNNLSPRSLILFDELGRGTSTYDGISIAWAIIEYIHEHQAHNAKTLFATHYHEINEMEKTFKRIKNFSVSVKEVDNKIVFMRKLVPHGSEHSFGIHVAQMAGMPKSIVKRANEILKQLEADNRQQEVKKKPIKKIASSFEGYQYNLFQLDDPVLCQIRDEILNLDINHLTPMEAMHKLYNIKKILTGKSEH
jgi:DNA mismatch repair protein MutS